MGQVGTVNAEEGLRLRAGPGTQHDILAVLLHGELLNLSDRAGDWWQVESLRGAGFVHADFVQVESDAPVRIEEQHAGDQAQFYTCVDGDTLGAIGARLRRDFREIAALNGIVSPFVIQVGQVLRLSGAPPRVILETVAILNPLDFDGQTQVTSSSLQGHHTPYRGNSSCDLDIRGASTPGTPVRFNVAAPDGTALRGRVAEVGFACGSRVLSDGGRFVKIAIQTSAGGDAWQNSGARVLYAHLDPVSVSVGDIVPARGFIGALGPDGGGEYDSPCARGSHIHVEATGAGCTVDEGAIIRNETLMTLDA